MPTLSFIATLWTAHVSLLSCRAAINHQLATSDKGRFVRREIQHSVGDISATFPSSLPMAASSRFLRHLDHWYEYTYIGSKYTSERGVLLWPSWSEKMSFSTPRYSGERRKFWAHRVSLRRSARRSTS